MTLCLNMIVRDESHVIERAIASALPFIDSWCIVDTGSKDVTVERVQEALKDLPGAVYRREWKGFGAARSEALVLAREHGDFALVLDADEILSGSLEKPLMADAYGFYLHFPNGNRSRVHRVFNLRRPWRYEGRFDEYPTCDGPWDYDVVLPDLMMSSGHDGQRSLDPEKRRKDAHVLGEMVVEDPKNARNVFHLAQAWRDAGDDVRAERHYLQRAEMDHGLNGEEIYISLLEAGRAQERLGRGHEAIFTWMKAHCVWPERCEAPRELWRVWLWRAECAKDVGTLYNEFKCSTALLRG